jgi:putative ABC transport system permease protein
MRQILRRLGLSPVFTTITILTLALGIGANSAVFTVINAVLFKPLPIADSDRLVALWHTAPGVGITELNMSPSNYFLYREEGRAFTDVALWRGEAVTVTGTAAPEQIQSLYITDGFLPLLQVQPILGRSFTPKDDSPGQPGTVMLTHGYWQRKFGADPGIVGKRILIDSQAREVIGILPSSYSFMSRDTSVLLPFQINRSEVRLGNFSHQGIARLKPGLTLEAANSDIARMLPRLTTKFPPPPGMSPKVFEEARISPTLRLLKDHLIGDLTQVLWVLMAAIGLVLFIACANVANLVLVRVDGRDREIAVRSALGASRFHILKDLLTETAILGLAGGLVGVGIAYGAIRLLHVMAPPYLPRLNEINLDATTLAFTLLLAILSGLLLGLIPAFKLFRRSFQQSLRSGGRTMSEGHRFRDALVIIQVALAVVLLIGAGLMIRTMTALTKVQPGFTQPEQLTTFHISIPQSLVPDSKNVLRAAQDLKSKLESIPGVQSVGIGNSITMDGNDSNDPIFAEGVNYREGQLPPIRRFKFVSPNYFATLGNPLTAGRDLSWNDITDTHNVVLLSENLASELFGNPNAALGKRIRENPKGPWREVIGVVGNEHDDGVDRPATKCVYWPLSVKDMYGRDQVTRRDYAIAVRTNRTGTTSLMNEIRNAVWSINPNLPIANPQSMQAIYARSMARTSFTLTMLSISSGLALLLGIIGIYGVISYSVSQRTREIGIRLALGSPTEKVRNLFLGHAIKLTFIGVAAGLAIAFPTGKLLASLLYDIKPTDPATYLSVAAALLIAAALAAYLPARRATRLSPMASLAAD